MEPLSSRAMHVMPHYVRVVDGFPMPVTGKLQKCRMREAMAGELTGVSG